MELFLINDKSLSKSDKIQLGISYFLQLTLLIAILYAIYKQNWEDTFLISGIFILTSLPAILRRSYKVRLPVEIDLVIILFIFATLFMGDIQSFYYKFWWWDGMLHTLGGILFGIAGFLLVYVLNREKKINLNLKPFFIALFSISFTSFIVVVWEIFEYSMDYFFGFNLQETGLVDTMWDLIVAEIGALLVILIGYWYMRKQRHFVDNLILKFLGLKPIKRLKKLNKKYGRKR